MVGLQRPERHGDAAVKVIGARAGRQRDPERAGPGLAALGDRGVRRQIEPHEAPTADGRVIVIRAQEVQ